MPTIKDENERIVPPSYTFGLTYEEWVESLSPEDKLKLKNQIESDFAEEEKEYTRKSKLQKWSSAKDKAKLDNAYDRLVTEKGGVLALLSK